MLLIATFLTIHFGEWRQSWHGMPRRTQVGADARHAVGDQNEGVLAAIDAETGQIVCQRILDTPAGFAIAGDRLYVSSMYANRILTLNSDLEVTDTFANRLMNDLHSVVPSPDGLLVTSSGTDAIVEITPDGDLRWDWLASEHGYASAPNGHPIKTSRHRDYRFAQVDTAMQATHCNSAVLHRVDGRPVVLATLFHQGQLVAIDRATGTPEVLVRGMRNPHAIRRRPGGWVVSDSRSSAVVLLGEDFWIDAIIEDDFNWIQDALPLDQGTLLIADANNSRFVFWDLDGGTPIRSVHYPAEWKVYQVEVADQAWDSRLRATGARAPVQPAA